MTGSYGDNSIELSRTEQQPSFPELAFIEEKGDEIQRWSKSLGPQRQILECPGNSHTPPRSPPSSLNCMPCAVNICYVHMTSPPFPSSFNRNSVFLGGTPPHLFQAFLVGLSDAGPLLPLQPQRVGRGPQELPSKSLVENVNLGWSCC